MSKKWLDDIGSVIYTKKGPCVMKFKIPNKKTIALNRFGIWNL